MISGQAVDGDLWVAAVDGDQAALGALFDRHAKAVYNHCFRLSASWAVAEDATQATVLIAWRKRDRVRLVNASVLPWLLTVAGNAVRDERRAARRWGAALLRVPLADRCYTDPSGKLVNPTSNEEFEKAYQSAMDRCLPAERWP